MYEYVRDFEKLGFGMFVHFGLYSVLGKGEWAKFYHKIPNERYEKLKDRFNVKKNFAKELVATAKAAGCKYITITSRHHEGFSLYDTMGLNDYDAPHSKTGRDIIREFVTECNLAGIKPMFYHTLLDWYNKDYNDNFPKYIDYLIKSVEILCTQYGKIGGLWFDGWWDKPDADWQFDRLYATIRRHQPDAMIINNTGMNYMGLVGHSEIDSVTFERGKPNLSEESERPIATEMCQVFNDHWGYAKNDIAYKSLIDILEELVLCRSYNSNYLINIGPTANGSVRPIDKYMLAELGRWVKYNKDFIYDLRRADIECEGAYLLRDSAGSYYAVVKTPMISTIKEESLGGQSLVKTVRVNGKIKSAKWLDNGRKIATNGNSFVAVPFEYGTSMIMRVAKLEIEK